LADLMSAIKGDMAYWIELAPALAPPHIGFYVQCPDAARAKDLAGYVGQYLDIASKMLPPPDALDGLQAVPPPGGDETKAEPKQDPGKEAKPAGPAVVKKEFKGHTIFTEGSESPLVTIPDREVIPYRLTWAVHRDRVFFTSSMAQMEKRLTALDSGAPGFDPTKVLPQKAPPVSSIKGMVVVDIKQMLDYGAKFGLPVLSALAAKDKEIQTELLRLAELAQNKSLFEDLPPLVMAGMPPQGKVQTTIMWTPAPYIPTIAVGAAGAGFFARGRAAGRRPGGRATKPPAPPPDVNF
jgi:hypothetical protein